MRDLTIATRTSPLAMWQAKFVRRQIKHYFPNLTIHINGVQSSGDNDRETPLYGMGNIGVFSKEVHQCLLQGNGDIGVHSCKDLPTTSPDGIATPIIAKRHDPRDALIGPHLNQLSSGAAIGSSSLRRRAQLAALRPDLRFVDIRGNVDTRMRKVAEGLVDGTLLACAGLKRLGRWATCPATPLNPITECIPAPAQGALAIDCRQDDHFAARIIAKLRHHQSAIAVGIERQILHGLRGGCSLPFGCYVYRKKSTWHCHAALADTSGKLQHVYCSGPATTLAQHCLKVLQQ